MLQYFHTVWLAKVIFKLLHIWTTWPEAICCSNTNFSWKSLTKDILLLPQDVCAFCFLSNLELLYNSLYKPPYNSTMTSRRTTTPGWESLLYITLKALGISSYCHWHLFSSLLSSCLSSEHIVTSPFPRWRAPWWHVSVVSYPKEKARVPRAFELY